MGAQRNVFFGFDEDAVSIAPARRIPVTEAMRADDAAKQAARTVHITWTPRLSEPKPRQTPSPKTHALAKVHRAFDPEIHHGACRRGHAYTPENTMLQSSGTRRCRECRNAALREWSRKPEAKKKAKERQARHGEA